MSVNWGALQLPNYFDAAARGWDQGRAIRSEREMRMATNLFATDPEAGARAMIASGRPDVANAFLTANRNLDSHRARTTARPFLEQGDYAGAAKAAAGLDPAMSRELQGWDKERLDRTHELGKRGSQIIMAASALPDPQARSDYIQKHTDELLQYGFKPEQIAGYDVSDPLKMRADAAKFMDLGTLAGKVSVEKFGDYAVTYQTDPIRGTRAVGKTEIPETRAERRAAASEDRQEREFAWRQKYDMERLKLAVMEEERQAREQGNPYSSPAKVLGPIFAKMARGEALTAGEERAVYAYKLDPITADAMKGGLTGEEGGGAAGDAGEYGRAAGEGVMGGRPGARPPPRRPPPSPGNRPAVRSLGAAPQNPAQRRAGGVYDTPKGPLKWTGTGWVEP
jgi:hypothetical protein